MVFVPIHPETLLGDIKFISSKTKFHEAQYGNDPSKDGFMNLRNKLSVK